MLYIYFIFNLGPLSHFKRIVGIHCKLISKGSSLDLFHSITNISLLSICCYNEYMKLKLYIFVKFSKVRKLTKNMNLRVYNIL